MRTPGELFRWKQSWKSALLWNIKQSIRIKPLESAARPECCFFSDTVSDPSIDAFAAVQFLSRGCSGIHLPLFDGTSPVGFTSFCSLPAWAGDCAASGYAGKCAFGAISHWQSIG